MRSGSRRGQRLLVEGVERRAAVDRRRRRAGGCRATRPRSRSWTLAGHDRLADDLGRPVALVGDADELVAEPDRADDLGRRRQERDDAHRVTASGAGGPARADRGARVRRLQRVERGPRGRLVREPGRVDRRVVRPLGRQRLLGEDRVDRAFRLAGAAVDALVRIDEQLAIRRPPRSGCSRPGRPRRTRGRARRCTARRSHRSFRILLEAHRSQARVVGRAPRAYHPVALTRRRVGRRPSGPGPACRA